MPQDNIARLDGNLQELLGHNPSGQHGISSGP
jgi:hypothetical protein